MRRSILTTLVLATIFGASLLASNKVEAGDPGAQEVNGVCREKAYCLVYGDLTQYCKEPSRCPGGQPVPSPTPLDATAIGLSHGKSAKPPARVSRSFKVEAESSSRQASSALLSLLTLFVGGALAVWSCVKLGRLSTASMYLPRGSSNRFQFVPRLAGYCAGIVAIGVLGSAAWMVTRSTRASGAPPIGVRREQRQSRMTPDAVTPQFSSAFTVGGTGIAQVGGTAIDGQGNVYVAGGFMGSMTFNTSPQPTTLNSTEAYDVYLAKLSPSGQPLWARMANGATGLTFTDPATKQPEDFSYDGALAVAVDADDNAYVGGGFVQSLSFKDASGAVVASLHDNTDPNNDDINFELFVAKYDASGSLIWARGGESGAADSNDGTENLDSGINGITDIVIDRTGVPYVAGTFSGANFLGHSVTPAGGRDILLSRLDPSTGAPVWVVTPGSSDTDAALGLAIDDTASLYLIGDMGGTITFPTQPLGIWICSMAARVAEISVM